MQEGLIRSDSQETINSARDIQDELSSEGLRPNAIMLNGLSSGSYGRMRTQFREKVLESCEIFLKIAEAHPKGSQINMQIAKSILRHLKSKPFEEVAFLIDYLSALDFETKWSGDEVNYLPNAIGNLLKDFDYKRYFRALERDHFDVLRAKVKQKPGNSQEELQDKVRLLELEVAGLRGELNAGKQNESQAVVLHKEVSEIRPMLESFMIRFFHHGGAAPVVNPWSADGLTFDLEKTIVLTKKFVSNPRLLLIKQLSELHKQEGESDLANACVLAVWNLMTDVATSMKDVILNIETQHEIAFNLDVSNVQENISDDSKVVKYVYQLIKGDYDNAALAAKISEINENALQSQPAVDKN